MGTPSIKSGSDSLPLTRIFSCAMMMCGIPLLLASATLTSALIIEAVVYVGFIVLLSRNRAVVRLLRDLSHLHRGLLIGCLVLMIGAQLLGRSHRTFPFVGWSMFTRSRQGDARYLEYRGTTRHGAPTSQPLVGIFDTVKMRWRLKGLIEQSEKPQKPEKQEAARTEFNRLLRAAADAYNRRNAEDPLRSIRVSDYTVPLRAYRDRSSVEGRFLAELNLD